MLSDIEIAQSYKCKDITTILGDEYKDIIEPYGKDMGKISYTHIDEEKIKDSTLILVTAITPTKAGIGKTTVSVGLNDALNKIGKKSIAVLREPSLGPCFGMKGGACGGGYSQVIPMEKINLHFTGDFHAITSANNMIAAALDSYLYFNKDILNKIAYITFKRCVDVNDRSLRHINYKIGDRTFDSGFNITPASELMAIFCLATDLNDLRKRIDNIILAKFYDGRYLYCRDLQITGSIIALLSEAFKPNIVQSLEQNPVLIHGGPFANIAHGCNSIVATKLGMSLRKYVVTEAGFGADLGAEKFFDIKCRTAGIVPDVVVLVVTIPGLKQFTGNIEDGFKNLEHHYMKLRRIITKIVITYNARETDDPADVKKLMEFVNNNKFMTEYGKNCIKNTCFTDGGDGAKELAWKCVHTSIIESVYQENNFIYSLIDPLDVKIKKIVVRTYGYKDSVNIRFKDIIVENKFKEIANSIEFAGYEVCIAKTQYSTTDNPNIVPVTGDYNDFTITDIEVNNGAQFIVVSAGNMMRMPGLPKEPAAQKINFINGKITGLS